MSGLAKAKGCKCEAPRDSFLAIENVEGRHIVD
jgi:hypothetical protein